MFITEQIKNSSTPVPAALALTLFFLLIYNLPASAQSGSVPALSSGNFIYGSPGTTSLRDPLVSGASFSLPGLPSSQGAIPPIGSGFAPLPPNPGMMMAPPTVIPWASGYAGVQYSMPTNQVVAPANQINLQSNEIGLPVNNAVAMPPGAMNAAVRGSVPIAPSVPGADPGMLRPPSFYNGGSSAAVPGQNVNSAAAVTNIEGDGQAPVGVAPTKRPVRQSSNDFGLKRGVSAYYLELNGTSGPGQWIPKQSSTTTDFGQGDKVLATPQRSYDSPLPAQYPGQAIQGAPPQDSFGNHNLNFPNASSPSKIAQVTNDLYGIPMVNPNKMTTSETGATSRGNAQLIQPMTTIIPPPTR